MNISSSRGAVVFLCTSLLLSGTTLAQSEDRQTESLERAVEEWLENCETDGARFCSSVNPGEGRVLACLQAYVDQVSEECRESLAVWQRPDPVLDYQTIRIYPTLEDRELGEQNIDETGERVIWKQKLPFFAQQVVDLGLRRTACIQHLVDIVLADAFALDSSFASLDTEGFGFDRNYLDELQLTGRLEELRDIDLVPQG